MPDSLSSWLSAVKARLAAATPGPWVVHGGGKRAVWYADIETVAEPIQPVCQRARLETDAFFIAAAPSDLAVALAVIEAVEILLASADGSGRVLIRDVRAAMHSAFEAEKS